jgi:glucose/mannose transport system permease protein
LKTFDLLYAIDQRSIKIDTPSLYMWFTTFDGGFYNRGATIATVLLIGVAIVIVPYIRHALRRNRT